METVGNIYGMMNKGCVADNKVYISLPDAKNILMRGLRYALGEDAVWQPEYNEVADWLSDNKGRGLLCMGNCGRGKTIITQVIMPLIFRHYCGLYLNTVTAIELDDMFNDISRCKIIGVDDIGTETETVKFGEHHLYFAELVYLAERQGKLLILSTNLDGEELKAKYGERITDRLRSITTQVAFPGQSLRK